MLTIFSLSGEAADLPGQVTILRFTAQPRVANTG